jgi:hypothetical protein
MPLRLSSATIAGTDSISASVLRASRPMAVRWYAASPLRTVCAMNGASMAAGMLSMQ